METELVELLRIAHDKMDDFNAVFANPPVICQWCKSPHDYKGDGLQHEKDCILVRIRNAVNLES